MKKLILISLFAILAIKSNAATYNVTAYTNSSITQNYSIALQVNATCFGSSCSVGSVSAYTEYGLQNVSWGTVIGQPGTYYVMYNYRTYYFRF